MPSETDSASLLRTKAATVRTRTDPLFDWASWVTGACTQVIEHHIAVASLLDPSLDALRLDGPVGTWSPDDWDRFWTNAGHTAWAAVCEALRGDCSGSTAIALRAALIDTDRVDGLSVILHRLRFFDREWASEVLARRVERLGPEILDIVQQHGVAVVSAKTSPTAVRLLLDAAPSPDAARRILNTVQAIAGVSVSLALAEQHAPL